MLQGIKLNENLGAISQDSAQEIINFVNSLTAPQKEQVERVLASVAGGKNATSRDKLIARLMQITDMKVVNGVLNGDLLIKDHEIFKAVTISAAASYSEIYKQSDTILVGVANLNMGRLDAGQYMLVDSVGFHYGVNATLNITAWTTAIAAAVANGWLNIKCGGRQLLPNYFSVQNFMNAQNASAFQGQYKLDNPFWIGPEEFIEAHYTGPAAAASNANIRLSFRGAIIIPR